MDDEKTARLEETDQEDSLAHAPPILAEASEDLLVVKHGPVFVCSRRDGDIRQRAITGEGIYRDDTRFLSELVVTIGGRPPVLLSSSAALAYQATFEATNPMLRTRDGDIPQMTLNLRRTRLVAGSVYESFEIHNHSQSPVRTRLELTAAADFVDIFLIRGVIDDARKRPPVAAETSGSEVRFRYVGRDRTRRQVSILLDPAPSIAIEGHRAVISWDVSLAPKQARSYAARIDLDPTRHAVPSSRSAAEAHVKEELNEWRNRRASIVSDNRLVNRVLDASLRDLRALVTPIGESSIIAAGIPWFVAPFGRDALLTSYEMLLVDPITAREVLGFLAHHQARDDDALRDAEPGKILHEMRFGELARSRTIPHTPYYGTVDATPLFLMLAGAYHRWTGDLDSMRELKPALDRALRWIDDYGDADGDGFVEYERRSPAGLRSHGWKDSDEAIIHRDGSVAEGPIALVEVQAYVYLAKLRIAEVYDYLGEGFRAAQLRAEASRMKEAFNRAFWMPEEGTYALALDGDKRQVTSVASNVGHCLYCGIVDRDKAPEVARRLMASDMFSGWGIRTLASSARGYNPMSYHRGSVWPHDSSILAAGLKRYGFVEETEAVAGALFDAANESVEFRLPELYCGFPRTDNLPFVSYPVACSPQAWAAAAPFMLVQAFLGISADAPHGVLTINQPHLPQWIDRLEITGLAVGDAVLSLAFTRTGRTTAFALTERRGDIRVTVQQ